MKSVKKIFKWTGITILGILFILMVLLSITGLPKSPALTTVGVPRIPLTSVQHVWSLMRSTKDVTRFAGWSSTQKDCMLVFKVDNFYRKLHRLDGPQGVLDPIEIIPEEADGSVGNPVMEKQEIIYYFDNDGDELYQLYHLDLKTGTSTLLTQGDDKNTSVRWDPEGEYILYQKNKKNSKNYDLYRMDPQEPGSEELVLELEGIWQIDDWTNDGKRIALRKYISATEKEPYLLDLEKVVLTPLSMASSAKANYDRLVWSKNGQTLYYSSTYESDFSRLRVHDLRSGKDSILLENFNWDITAVKNSPDGQWLSFLVNQDGQKQLYLYDLRTGKTETIQNLPFGDISYASFNLRKNSTIGLGLVKVDNTSELYSYDLETKELTQWLTSTAEEDLLPDPEIIHYPTFDRDSLTGKTREITAYYHRPPADAQKPYPVIIDIHGGPMSQATITRSPMWNDHLNKGYAFLAPNVRGSTGYGSTFTNLDNGLLREDAVKDIGALLDWIEEQPELDATKVIVFGGSYGGYMSLACAVHYSDRLLGAVDLFGISNFVRMQENTPEGIKEADKAEYGDIKVPHIREGLENISPSNHVDKIDIPLFIYQGVNDQRVPVSESRQMVAELQKQNKEVWYVEAADEGHGVTKPWNTMYMVGTYNLFIDRLMEEE